MIFFVNKKTIKHKRLPECSIFMSDNIKKRKMKIRKQLQQIIETGIKMMSEDISQIAMNVKRERATTKKKIGRILSMATPVQKKG